MRLPATAAHHTTPSGVFLVVVIVLVLLYVGWRTGRLRRLRTLAVFTRARHDLGGVRIRPLSFVPLAVLLIVIAVIVLAH